LGVQPMTGVETPQAAEATSPASLPEREALAALLGIVALFVLVPYWRGLDGSAGPIALSNARLGGTLAAEILLAATLGTWLWRRGWRPYHTILRPFAWRDLLRGLGLWATVIAVVVAWALVLRLLLPSVTSVAMRSRWVGHPHLGLVIPFVLFNAVFEEMVWLGIALIAFRRFGLGVAGALSVGLRLMVHAYQGPLALVSIIPMGVVFTTYYVRSHRWWPVVVAHSIQDLVALGAVVAGISPRSGV
jgi:uncharacterized protein